MGSRGERVPWAAGMGWHGPGSGRCGKEQQQADDRRDGGGKKKRRREDMMEMRTGRDKCGMKKERKNESKYGRAIDGKDKWPKE